MNRIEAVLAGMKMVRELTLEESHGEIERLRAHVADLQSGMWINCVYCGHRYGPRDTTAPVIPGAPISMAESLARHIATCPLHPMSAYRAVIEGMLVEVEKIQADIKRAIAFADSLLEAREKGPA
jgi:hypothetical protein